MRSSELAPNELLKTFFDRKKTYSLRALARDLGVSHSFVSEIFNGKKPIPARHVERLISLLEVDFESATALKSRLNSFSIDSSAADYTPAEDFEYLPVEEERFLEKWYYPAMLELTTVDDFNGDFATALGITPYEADYGVGVLKELKLLIETEDGRYKKSPRVIRYSTGTSKKVVRDFHKSMLDKAKCELDKPDQQGFDSRYIIGMSLAMSEEDIGYAKLKISKFVHELSMELAQKEVDSTYYFSMQLFPVVSKGMIESMEHPE